MQIFYLLLICLLLLIPMVNADEAEIKKSADEATEKAEDELSKLEETVGKSAGKSASDASRDAASDKSATAATKADEESSKPWLPAAKNYDWVQLTSGEWLKGEIKSMYNKNLEFDSDKLKLLNIKWKDVKYLKSYRPSSVNIENRLPISGSLQISDDTVTITGGETVQEFDRLDLISLTPAGDREADLWAIKLSLGLNVKRGNTDQVDYTAQLGVKRRTAKTRFLLDYIGNISKTGNQATELTETVNNHRISASHSVYTTRYFFYQPVFAELYRDPFQNIGLRMNVGAGMGYTLFDTGQFEWIVNGGPAYVSTKFISVQPGEKQKVDGAALVFGTDIDAELSSTLDFIFKYNILLADEGFGGYTHHLIATLETEITSDLNFDVSLIWDRISQPIESESGVTPKPDDFRLVFSVSYDY